MTANTTTYKYDGLGQRVSKQTGSGTPTQYVRDGFGNLAAEYSPSDAASCATCYLSTDHLGSTRLVTDGSGGPVARHDYLPFGVEVPNGYSERTGTYGAADGLSPKFTGKERDGETGLAFLQARYLGTGQGRFMSVDPDNAGTDLVDSQSFNGYSYVKNKSVVAIDPDGLDSCDAFVDSCGGWGWGGLGWGGIFWPPVFWPTGGEILSGPSQLPPGVVFTVPRGGGVGGGFLDCNSTLKGCQPTSAGPVGMRVTWQPRRLFNTCYCGPGGGSTTGAVDGSCAAHDACYEAAGINAGGNTNLTNPWSPQQVTTARGCNQTLYDAVKTSSQPGATGLQLWLRYGDKLPQPILRPGTSVRRR